MYLLSQKEIDKTSKTASEIIVAFRKEIDDVYLIERTNYDVQNSLDKPKIIVLSEYLKGEGV